MPGLCRVLWPGEAYFADFFAGAVVVFLGDRAVEQVSGDLFLRPHLRRGTEEEAAVALFEDDFVAFEQAEALTKVGGEFDGSGLGDAGGGHGVPLLQGDQRCQDPSGQFSSFGRLKIAWYIHGLATEISWHSGGDIVG